MALMNATVTVRKNEFARMARKFPIATAQATNRAMARTIEVSTPLTPIDKGPLRANVVIRGASPGNQEGEIHWAQEYAGHQNFGTVRGIVGKHFVEQGLASGKSMWAQELAELESELA